MDTIDREKFGAFIAALRKERGMTQQELADRLFLSNKAVSKWERGQSLPDITLLKPLAQCLGVTVTELLQGERLAEGPLASREAEDLVGRALQFSGDNADGESGRKRRRWQLVWALSALLGAAGTAVLRLLGYGWADLGSNVLLVEMLCLIFGLWAVFFAPERLPAYYDENHITAFSQGPFRMNLGWIRFHNGNWSHILAALRLWVVVTPVAYPAVYGLLRWFVPRWELPWELGTTLFACLGLFIPVTILAKRYE